MMFDTPGTRFGETTLVCQPSVMLLKQKYNRIKKEMNE